jgi:hypothetical protein
MTILRRREYHMRLIKVEIIRPTDMVHNYPLVSCGSWIMHILAGNWKLVRRYHVIGWRLLKSDLGFL